MVMEFGLSVIAWLGIVLLTVLLGTILWLVYAYLADKRQPRHAIRRNFPVIGRFRYLFEYIGEFFRQYFFAMDREELPFNRAQRGWVYKAAKGMDGTIAFGSTRNMSAPGTIMFVNSPFPSMATDAVSVQAITLGNQCRHPYTPQKIFNISGMSYGALSQAAVTALSQGAKKVGCWINTGEGGVSPYHLESGADLVVQIGTAKYGVRNESGELCDNKLQSLAAHETVKMFELKLSQGAKPGKGGILPGHKVTEQIAGIRGIPVGSDSISPNRHPEIESVDDLLDMISHIRNVTGKPVGFKAAFGDVQWLKELCESVQRREDDCAPDFITVDGAEGGTGAAPLSLMDYMALPIRDALPQVVGVLRRYELTDRIRVVASGKMIHPADVAWAIAVGADFVTSARGFMFSLGCIQALQCHKNTCPTGITTHDPELQQGLVVREKSERVAQYAQKVCYELGVIAHSCGVPQARQLTPEHMLMVDQLGRTRPWLELNGEASRYGG